MSGHSKWATTKHKKAVVDARRGKMFARLIKNIEVAARVGGGDPAGNPTLYDAIQKARRARCPMRTSSGHASAAPVRKPVAPTGRPSCTRVMRPTAWRC
ncbi:transcriptional regulator family protein [Mycobacterium kansasii]|uniref:Transcriptional regulator family protein n=1 Tax=Mycobacterium kansasii TaxID=1768 RepID=A0A1V3W9I4_MYCKA|nr:transcriptional regulator family protein [Mycobacterium kansasii]